MKHRSYAHPAIFVREIQVYVFKFVVGILLHIYLPLPVASYRWEEFKKAFSVDQLDELQGTGAAHYYS